MKPLLAALPLVVGLLASSGARADPRLDEKVYTPYVQNGVGEVEVLTARQIGGAGEGQLTTVIEAEYGINDRISLSLVGAVERAPGEATRFTSVGVEAVAYLGQIPKLGVDVGGYLEYGQGLNGESNALEGKLLLAKTAGRFQGLLNLIVERPLGPKDQAYAAYGYAASATWRTVGALRVGAEAFGDLGSDHGFPGPGGAYVGPQLLWEGRPPGSPVEIDLDLGWLFPVGADRREAASQARIGLELEHRF
jgi:hypothetical protein